MKDIIEKRLKINSKRQKELYHAVDVIMAYVFTRERWSFGDIYVEAIKRKTAKNIPEAIMLGSIIGIAIENHRAMHALEEFIGKDKDLKKGKRVD